MGSSRGLTGSMGRTGVCWDNSMAPLRGIDDVEIAVAEYIDWFNHRRLHGEIGMVPVVEYEEQYYSENPVIETTKTRELSLH
jgi:putative transposase